MLQNNGLLNEEDTGTKTSPFEKAKLAEGEIPNTDWGQ